MEFFEDFRKIRQTLEKIYGKKPDISIILGELNKIDKSKEKAQGTIEKYASYLFQFLFKSSLVFIKNKKLEESSRSSVKSTLRHNFPKNFEFNEQEREKFFNLISKYFGRLSIKIKLAQKGDYFFLSDYNSILNILLFWDKYKLLDFAQYDPRDNVTLNGFKEIFRTREILIFFDKEFLDKIFGKFGLIKKSGLTYLQFSESLNIVKKFDRRDFHYWTKIDRNKPFGYIPLKFLKNLLNSKYKDSFDLDISRYIKYIHIGKAKSKESKTIRIELLKKIINSYNDWFVKFIPKDSNLNYLFGVINREKEEIEQPFTLVEEYVNTFKKKYKDIIYKKHFNRFKSILTISENPVFIKSVELINFKSYSNEKVVFENGINIIYGPNGSGKTTIIEAILFALLRYYTFTLEVYPYVENIFVLNPWLIKFGEKECEVILKLKCGEKDVEIDRIMGRNGNQKLFINQVDMLSHIDPKYYSFIDNPEIKSIKFSISRENLVTPIINKFKELGILFEKNDIYSSLYQEYDLFWNIEKLYFNSDSDEVDLFYANKLRLLLIDGLVIIKNMKRKEKNIKIAFSTFELLKNLFYETLYDIINKNEDYKFGTGRYFNCESCSSTVFGKPAYICQKCGAEYDDSCLEKLYKTDFIGRDSFPRCESARCNESMTPTTYKRREYLPEDFYELLEWTEKGETYKEPFSKHTWRKRISEVVNSVQAYRKTTNPSDSNGFDPLRHLLDGNPKETYSLIKSIMEDNKLQEYKKLKSRLNLQIFIRKNLIDRLKLCFENPLFRYLFNLIDKNKSEIKIDLKEISSYIDNSRMFLSLKTINYVLLLTISNLIQRKQNVSYSEENEKLINNIKNILNLMKNENDIDEIFKDFNDKIQLLEEEQGILSANRNEIANEFNQRFKPFEQKLAELLIYITELSSEFNEYRNTLKAYFEKIKGLDLHFKFYEDYIELSEWYLEEITYDDWVEYFQLDYKLLKRQLKNQIRLLEFIQSCNRNIRFTKKKIQKINKEVIFLGENKIILFNLFRDYFNKELKIKSQKIFKNEDFYSFLDEKGIPKLKSLKNDETYPTFILSGGERSKLILAILSLLIKISNRRTFFLIDEPNELLDSENIVIMKDYFSALFRNQQLIICTFIKKYIKFQPALVYKVKRDESRSRR